MRIDISELILDSGAVATALRITPGDHSSIRQDRSKSTACAKNLPNIPKPISHRTAVAANVSITPCHHGSITQSCSKCRSGATDLLDISQLVLHSGAVTAIVWTAPVSPRFCLPKWQQKQRVYHKSAGHSWADVGLWSCHHQQIECPRSRHFHLPKWQQKHRPWHKPAEHSEADLGLRSCYHHGIHRPSSPRFHLPELQQKHGVCHRAAEHSAALALWSCTVWTAPCHHRSICQNGSKGIVTTTNLLNISQLILHSGAVTAMVWQAPRNNSVSSNTPQSKRTQSCSYLWPLSNSSKAVTGQATSFCWIRKAPAHQGQQASGSVAARTSAQLISSQQRCQTARQREFHSVHSAGRPQARLGNQPSEDCQARSYRGQPISLLVSWSLSKKIDDFIGNNGSI